MICYDVSLAPRTTSLALFAASSIVVKFLAVYAFPLGGIYYTAMLLGSLRQKCEMSSLIWFKKKTVMKKQHLLKFVRWVEFKIIPPEKSFLLSHHLSYLSLIS